MGKPVRCYVSDTKDAPAGGVATVTPERRIAPRTPSTSRGEPVGRFLGTDAAAAEELFYAS